MPQVVDLAYGSSNLLAYPLNNCLGGQNGQGESKQIENRGFGKNQGTVKKDGINLLCSL